MVTGMGQSGQFDVGQWVASWTEYHWGQILETLKPSSVTMVSIWSCHSGAGADGAELLFRMAERCGRAVRARTGFTYNNGKKMWFENGSVWQVATPGNKPNPIAAPTPHFRNADTMKIGDMEISEDTVESISIKAARGPAAAVTPFTLAERESGVMLTSLLDRTPMNLDVGVMGFVTAQLEVVLKTGENITFDIYNDRIAVEKISKIGFYLTGSVMRLLETVSGG